MGPKATGNDVLEFAMEQPTLSQCSQPSTSARDLQASLPLREPHTEKQNLKWEAGVTVHTEGDSAFSEAFTQESL